MKIDTKVIPVLDADFIPAKKWYEAYNALIEEKGGREVHIALAQEDGFVFTHSFKILDDYENYKDLNIKATERLLKFLLWMKGGRKIYIQGSDELVGDLSKIYSESGARSFDNDFLGHKIYGGSFEFIACDEIPAMKQSTNDLGRHLSGCRIGFDLGGSDRKCAAVIDGKVVYSEEIAWDPYFESNPDYHYEGIKDSLERAAKHLPRVDAIGGSAAGVYIQNEVRAASLFRGISDNDFKNKIQRIFFRLQEEWDVPFEVVNDGEVTALAGSMSLESGAVLGISMGTSLAAGYVTANGSITPWLNELAFVPVDFNENAPADEWSGDIGCGVQYFSQQAVSRLILKAGITEIPEEMGKPEKLVEVQKLMEAGDKRAAKIYQTIGTYFGYTIAHFADFYDISKLLILGRVTSGQGGEDILKHAKEVLDIEYPELSEKIELRTPSESDKRHGQAVAAASLPIA
ncbi:MAG: ROK family protein [Lentisphaeraceae bacterium]|nr:ROK family protein [Lentisphaeraceae bacterium]